MKLPPALCYFGILFAALAVSGATAGEAEEVATAPLEPLSPDDSFEQQQAARSLRGMMEEDIWGEESGNFLIWEAEADDFRGELTSPPTAAPDDKETAGGGDVTEKDEVDISVTQAPPPGKCQQAYIVQCKQYDKLSCVRHSINAKKYCKWCPTCNDCVDKCAGMGKAACAKEQHCVWV